MKQYWNERYKSGRGSNSYHQREWETSIILKHTEDTLIDVIDVGCGDLLLWGGQLPDHYIGVDISQEIIQKNKQEWPWQTFLCRDMTLELPCSDPFDTVLCLNMLYHIMSVEGFRMVLNNLNRFTQKWLFISHWNHDPKHYDRSYQNYIPLREHLDALPDMELIEEHVFPDKIKSYDNLLSMYVFRRKEQ